MRPESLFPLFAPITTLRGVGARVGPLLQRLAGPRVRDVLFLLPQDLIFRRESKVAHLLEGSIQTVCVNIEAHKPPARAGHPWRISVFDDTGFLGLVFFKGYGPHLAERHPPGARRIVSGKTEWDHLGNRFQIVHPDYLVPENRAKDIPAIDPVYPGVVGLPSRMIRRFVVEASSRAPELVEWQDRAWMAKTGWPSWREAILSVHSPTSLADINPQSPVRRRLAYDELLAHQLALCERKHAHKRFAAPRISPAARVQEAVASLPFILTDAQKNALGEILRDLGSGERMTRLLQGDVGAGKTVVALLSMVAVASAGYQAALMAPTEILARQHYETVAPALALLGIRVVLLTGRHRGAARAERLAALARGEAKVAIGTHALFQEGVAFENLALCVIDEQHRFGVTDRLRLQAKGDAVHMLAMSATPIPRTLELTIFGDLDVSRLDQKPPGRRAIATRAAPLSRLTDVVDRLEVAVRDGAQAFWICPLVAESETADLAAAEARHRALATRFGEQVGLVHGRLSSAEKDAVMARFVAGHLAILVATTVVEVGVDVRAATIMVIEQAERFGLAQLHQLRGRVGRGAMPSSCILLYDAPLTETASRRLDVLRRTEDGFEIAERDLELRGGGDPLGFAQSGFPAYRLADPIAHRDLIAVAADDARLILDRDPEFLTPRGQALQVLKALFDWRAEGPVAGSG